MNRDHEELLRRLALNDETAVAAALGTLTSGAALSSLDPKTLALTRLAALVSSDPVAVSQEWGVGVALAMGASDEEVVAVLMAVAPLIGAAKTIIVATDLALALGCEIDLPD